MEKHVTIVGSIYIALGALCLLAALIVFVSIVGGGLLSGDKQAMAITAVLAAWCGG